VISVKGTSTIACPDARQKLASGQAIALAPFQCSRKPIKSGERPKTKKGPPPDVLRKSGAHKDKKRRTGREPIRKEDIEERNKD
jgi:hypothetical protein